MKNTKNGQVTIATIIPAIMFAKLILKNQFRFCELCQNGNLKRIFLFVEALAKYLPKTFFFPKINSIVCRERPGRAEHNLRHHNLCLLPHDIVRRRILHPAKHGGFQIYLRPVRFPGQCSGLLYNPGFNNPLYVVLDNGKNKRFTVRELKLKQRELFLFLIISGT